jgi:hypothetical protein
MTGEGGGGKKLDPLPLPFPPPFVVPGSGFNKLGVDLSDMKG